MTNDLTIEFGGVCKSYVRKSVRYENIMTKQVVSDTITVNDTIGAQRFSSSNDVHVTDPKCNIIAKSQNGYTIRFPIEVLSRYFTYFV